ncbi:MAG: RagB/SusD family nutrient uptake outer membrane protein [Bacteroidales bacterium]|nr:RagB/SusD family nutrient uptake outer membrane protein [Bacteroidales bacterium]
MKKIINILSVVLGLSSVGNFTSCTDYLDKEPDSDVSTEAAFQNFNNFQGFVEEIYNNIPHKELCYWNTAFNWGEDEYVCSELSSLVTRTMDNGNFRAWFGDGGSWQGSYFHITNDQINYRDQNDFHHDIWRCAFYCIRKANLGLANIDLLTNATQEQKDAIRGQLLFFRAWWHEEVMIYLGGIPYIDKVLDGTERFPRPSFQECAIRAAEDFGEAAKYLPNDWNKSSAGNATPGENAIKITKATALAYQGKMLLWASSPLAENGAQTGGSNTYKYNTELAQKAAEALGEAINLVESGQTPYSLADYSYASVKDLTDHQLPEGTVNGYDDIFYTVKASNKQPGGKEAMMRGTPFNGQGSAAWGFANNWGPNINGFASQESANGGVICPTANYVDYAYGMKNGLPLDDPDSGWDVEHPFKDRDPRFYHDIIFDGVRYALGDATGTDFESLQYTSLYTDGIMREEKKGSITGYFEQKLVPHQWNRIDKWYTWQYGMQVYLPYMRLADVYLMYAEAGSAASGCTSSSYKANSCGITAVEAVNKIRERAGVDAVSGKYLSGTDFMDCVRRERACELAFEGFRFNDLQRWLLLTEYPYNEKRAASFTRVENDDWYKTNDPSEAQVKGYNTDKVVVKRNYTTKHYWFPFKDADVYLYGDFMQNPGW